ncbi:MAG: group II intron reverse transcriptase/maturase [Pseudomonadota bacterium]|nr:group II intron reverse transcriptase/maturase [Pseudomonadota bacterium]
MRTLAHHIDVDFMREAHRRTRKGGATGVDGQTAEDFSANLEENLKVLVEALHSGRYRPPPVRRTYVPKADGRQRPLGIPTFADKVLQQAVAMVLTAVYEPHFHAGSFGFRPRRSAHQALDTLRATLTEMQGGWVIDADIQGYFDVLDHAHLRDILCKRMNDSVLVRAVGKWLNAGVMEGGAHHATSAGTPQGGVISPILANIYLDEVLDWWFEREVRPRLRGRSALIRYADDFVLVIEHEDDARRVMAVLSKRFERFGLTLHPEKTRLLDFRHPRRGPSGPNDAPASDGPRSFDFLGFMHHWKGTRRGGHALSQQTAGKRLSRSLASVNQWCRTNRHRPIAEQHRGLLAKLRGHSGYYNRIGNRDAVSMYRFRLIGLWRRWLNRRSQRARLWWHRFKHILARFPIPSVPRVPMPSSANP